MWRKTGKTTARQGSDGPKTALTQYQRLESIGLWRDRPDAQRREVVLRMGEATLIFSDPRSGAVLTHWSLPAVERLNPGETPALFAPGRDAHETVEIADEDMRRALKTVQSAVRSARPHPWRLRGWLVGGVTAAILGLGVLVLPGVLRSHTASVVPPAKRADIGMRALDDVTRLTGAPCDNPMGLAALADLSERIFGLEDTPLLFILPEGLERPARLPGGVILLPQSLIQGDSPDALAGAALVEHLVAKRDDPLRPILDHAGVRATLTLLTSGDLPETGLARYGEDLLEQRADLPPQGELVRAFRDAQVPMTPWLHWRDPAGTAAETAGLLAADPFAGLVPSPLMDDGNWIALQGICTG